MDIESFSENWSRAGISERARYQKFAAKLCAIIGAPGPDEEPIR